MGEERPAAAMIGVTEEKEKNGRKAGTRIGKNPKNPEKTLKKHLTTVGECGILSELQESSAQVEAKRGKKQGSEGTERKNLKKVQKTS